jgi:hypothetical protein
MAGGWGQWIEGYRDSEQIIIFERATNAKMTAFFLWNCEAERKPLIPQGFRE